MSSHRLILLILGILIAVGAIYAIVRKRQRAPGEWGFKDVVKNPEYWEYVAANHKRLEEEKKVAQSWRPAQIDRALRHFLFEIPSTADGTGEKQVLQSLGD